MLEIITFFKHRHWWFINPKCLACVYGICICIFLQKWDIRGSGFWTFGVLDVCGSGVWGPFLDVRDWGFRVSGFIFGRSGLFGRSGFSPKRPKSQSIPKSQMSKNKTKPQMSKIPNPQPQMSKPRMSTNPNVRQGPEERQKQRQLLRSCTNLQQPIYSIFEATESGISAALL